MLRWLLKSSGKRTLYCPPQRKRTLYCPPQKKRARGVARDFELRLSLSMMTICCHLSITFLPSLVERFTLRTNSCGQPNSVSRTACTIFAPLVPPWMSRMFFPSSRQAELIFSAVSQIFRSWRASFGYQVGGTFRRMLSVELKFRSRFFLFRSSLWHLLQATYLLTSDPRKFARILVNLIQPRTNHNRCT